MPRKPEPYCVSPLTGKSVTRDFVERFLRNCSGPVTEENENGTRITTPSILDTIYGLVPMPQESMYIQKAKDSTKRYVGRAARIAAGNNPHETLWCIKADIKSACLRLDKKTRTVLGLMYVADWSEDMIAERLAIKPHVVSAIVREALDRIAAILDNKA